MKKSSIITPPPVEVGQGSEGNLALSEEQRREQLLKLIRKGAPSVPPKEGDARKRDERIQVLLRFPSSVVERVKRAASEREVKIPVNTWITEAIISQLKKEGF